MNTFWYYRSLEDNPKYSCRVLNLRNNPGLSNVVREGNVPLGIMWITLGAAIQVGYIVSLSVIGQKEHFKFCAFKLMFALGVVDLLNLFFCADLSGYFIAVGATFCDFPILIYCVGSVITCLFNTSCLLCVLLMFNRLLDVAGSPLKGFLYKGNRTLGLILLSISIGFCFLLFQHPVIFNAGYGAWIFQPLIAGNLNHEYDVTSQNIFNMFVASSLAISCALIYFFQWRKEKTYNLKMVSYKKKILLQAILVCFFTFISTIIWTILGFLPNNRWMPILMHIGDFSWFMMHSMPALIYLTFNETIRSKVILIFGLTKKKFKVYSG